MEKKRILKQIECWGVDCRPVNLLQGVDLVNTVIFISSDHCIDWMRFS